MAKRGKGFGMVSGCVRDDDVMVLGGEKYEFWNNDSAFVSESAEEEK